MYTIEQLEKRKKLLTHLNSPSNQEVFTPMLLAEEILDKLPVVVWKNPNLTWVDICAKSGVFILEVIIRLMKNLPIEDETLRYNHIINNMVKVYVNVERNKWLVSKIVYGNTSYIDKVGIIKNIDNINIKKMPKFDIIIGNPPFQNKTKTTRSPLWPKFIKISASILTDNGFLILITPKSWINSELNVTSGGELKMIREEVFKYMTLLYTEIDTIKKYFRNVGSSFSYFVFQNKKNKNIKAQIVSLDNNGDINNININYNDIPYILNNSSKLSYNIANKTIWSSKEKLRGYFNEYPGSQKIENNNNKKTSASPWPIANTSAQYTKGIYKWSITKHPLQNVPKIIYSNSGYAKPFYDEGKLGIGHHSRAIFVKDKNEANKILKYLNSKLVRFLKSLKAGSHLAVDIGIIIAELPNINLLKNNFTDQELYKYFNLTEEEINYIESQIKNNN